MEEIACDGVTLSADLELPAGVRGAVVFAHGSGSGRHSPRNRRVAAALHEAGLGTLLIDLLTTAEAAHDAATAALRFDIGLLTRRLTGAVDWLAARGGGRLPIGCYGASTGAAAALRCAAARPELVAAVVSRGGRTDLADADLPDVRAATLLIAGGADPVVLRLNRASLALLGGAEREIVVIEGAGHLFEEAGALDQVADHSRRWFARHLGRPDPARATGPGDEPRGRGRS